MASEGMADVAGVAAEARETGRAVIAGDIDERARLRRARAASDALFALIAPEAMYDRPIPQRHRLVFYLGHLEAFDGNLLQRLLPGLTSRAPEWDKRFAFGIDPLKDGLPMDQPADWPPLDAVAEYGVRVRERLDAALDRPGAMAGPQPRRLLNVAIEHRLMHLETLAYLMHALPLERKRMPEDAAGAAAPAASPRRTRTDAPVSIPAGTATLGRRREEPGFGWDNEFEAAQVPVPAFQADRCKVTNGAFLEFVQSGGYSQPRWWRDEDWQWLGTSGLRHPRFWLRHEEEWRWRGMFGEWPLPLDAPVYVSGAEARAYCAWAGKALPTEAQWHRMAYGQPDGGERAWPWGEAAPAARHGNFDARAWDPEAVDAHPEGASAWGVMDLIGNGWEWTATPFAPLPGFQPFDFYPGYSADFFDGCHFVLKGGSPRTDATLLRRSFRNWFQPHYPFVFAGFRCVSR